jgi:hypothetical protein
MTATMRTTGRWDIHGHPLPPIDWAYDGERWKRQYDGVDDRG